MLKKTLGAAAIAAVLGITGTTMAQDTGTAGSGYKPPYPYPAGRFVDNPYYKYYGQNKPDECYFDFNTYDYYPEVAGYKVKFKKKIIVEKDPYYGYPVFYILTTAKCVIPAGYKAKKKVVFKNFPCTLVDNSKYDEEEDTLQTYDSKFVIKKGAKYGNLSCKFKVEKEYDYHDGEPMDDGDTPAAAPDDSAEPPPPT